MKISLFAVLVGILVLPSCKGFFGEKTDPSFIDVPIYSDRQVAYVPIQPVWEGFVRPSDLLIGYDELIYVVDAGTSEIIAYDQAGTEAGRITVPGVKSITMDRTLDILAIGTYDTTIQSQIRTLSAIYRIEQKTAMGYGLDRAFFEDTIIHPYYFKNSFDVGQDDVENFTGISVRGDNKFYVTRTGPNNSGQQSGGPDDSVLLFDEDGSYETPISVQTSTGLFRDYFKYPYSISTLAQAPQSPFVDGSGDFVFSSLSPQALLRVQYIQVNESEFGIDYSVKEMPVGDTSKADGFLYTSDRFASPVDVTYSGDGTNYIFVVDSEKDSLFQFTNTGLEGVSPPAGSTNSKNIKVSFGGTGRGLTQFNQPLAVAYYDRIVYVADAGNQRILRFKLTTDFD